MPIGIVIDFPGASARAKYQKSVKLLLKGRRKRLADWPAKGVLAHIAGPITRRLPRGRCLGIARGLQTVRQDTRARHEESRDARGQDKDFPPRPLYQSLTAERA